MTENSFFIFANVKDIISIDNKSVVKDIISIDNKSANLSKKKGQSINII